MAIGKIIAVIIVGLLIWQFGVPYIDPTIKTPLDYILGGGGTESIENSIFTPFIMDRTTTEETDILMGGTQFPIKVMEEYKSYSVGIKANLPGQLTGEYSWNIVLSLKNVTAGEPNDTYAFSIKIPAYQCYYKSRWTLSDDMIFFNYERSYFIRMSLYDPKGNPIETSSLENTNIYYQSSFYILEYDYVFSP